MTEKIIIAGAGGQGIMLMGRVLAEASLKDNKHITWLPCYGAEVRGGTAYCMVTISNQPISSPYIDKADSLIIMNEPSFKRFQDRLKHNGLLIINSLKYPFTDIALKLGNIKVANMVALGCYIAQKKIVGENSVLKVIKEIAPPDKRHLIDINKQALKEGIKLNATG